MSAALSRSKSGSSNDHSASAASVSHMSSLIVRNRDGRRGRPDLGIGVVRTTYSWHVSIYAPVNYQVRANSWHPPWQRSGTHHGLLVGVSHRLSILGAAGRAAATARPPAHLKRIGDVVLSEQARGVFRYAARAGPGVA